MSPTPTPWEFGKLEDRIQRTHDLVATPNALRIIESRQEPTPSQNGAALPGAEEAAEPILPREVAPVVCLRRVSGHGVHLPRRGLSAPGLGRGSAAAQQPRALIGRWLLLVGVGSPPGLGRTFSSRDLVDVQKASQTHQHACRTYIPQQAKEA